MRNIRTSAYIDGFNLFHALDELNDPSLKWLDLWSLTASLLRPTNTLTQVKYYSAYATWLPEAHSTHRAYVRALEATGVNVVLGKFKNKHITCKSCGQTFITKEEKQTDVNIAIGLIADCLQDRYDRAILISADTDLVAAVKEARRLRPDKEVFIAVPPGRLKFARDFGTRYEIKPGRLKNHLLAAQYKDARGKVIVTRPAKYNP